MISLPVMFVVWAPASDSEMAESAVKVRLNEGMMLACPA